MSALNRKDFLGFGSISARCEAAKVSSTPRRGRQFVAFEAGAHPSGRRLGGRGSRGNKPCVSGVEDNERFDGPMEVNACADGPSS